MTSAHLAVRMMSRNYTTGAGSKKPRSLMSAYMFPGSHYICRNQFHWSGSASTRGANYHFQSELSWYLLTSGCHSFESDT